MFKKTVSALVVAMALGSTPSFADGIWDQIEGNWGQLQGKFKQQWGDITDDSMLQLKGKRDELIGAIQEQYGIAKEEAEAQIDEWAEALELQD